MADKEKTFGDSALSSLMLLGAFYGVTKMDPSTKQSFSHTVQDLKRDVFGWLKDTPLLEKLRRKGSGYNPTQSGSKPMQAMLKPKPETPSVRDLITREKISETMRENKRVYKWQQQQLSYKSVAAKQQEVERQGLKGKHFEKVDLTAETGREMSGYVLKPPYTDVINNRRRITKYAAFLAYKEEYGLMRSDISLDRITDETLERYYQAYRIKAQTEGGKRIRQTYFLHLDRLAKDPSYAEWESMAEELGSVRTKPVAPMTGFHFTAGSRELQISPSDSFELIVKKLEPHLKQKGRIGEIRRKLSKFTGMPADTARKEAEDIARAYLSLQEQLSQVRDYRGNMTPRDLTVQMRLENRRFHGFNHRAILFEIGDKDGIKPQLTSRIPIQQGAYFSKSAGTLPITSPLYAPFGKSKPEDMLNLTRMYAQRLRAIAPTIAGDIRDTGNVLRASSAIQRLEKEVFRYGAPSGGKIQDIIRSYSVVFQDMNLAIGKGSKAEYKNLQLGVPSLSQLADIGAGNENMLVFDMEWTHPDPVVRQAGPQKQIKDAGTRIFNISAKVINTQSWEEISALDILIDPQDEKAYKGIREFYLNNGFKKEDVDRFISKELKANGASGYFKPSRYRTTGMGDAIKQLMAFAEQHNALKYKGGHNIAEADIPLLRYQFERLKHSGNAKDVQMYHALEEQVLKFLHTDPIKGSDGVIDTLFNSRVLDLGSLDKSRKLSELFKEVYGLDATAFGKVLDQAQKGKRSSAVPSSRLAKIAKEFGIKPETVETVYNQVRKMKLSTLAGTALVGAHAGSTDDAMTALLMMAQHDRIRTMPYGIRQFSHLKHVAKEMLERGNTSWNSAFDAMDMYQRGAFTMDREDGGIQLSLFSSSQQQMAKLIGSSLQVHHMLPFGLMNNLLRQHYQVYQGFQFAPATEEAIQEAAEKGFRYMPGEMMNTEAGRLAYLENQLSTARKAGDRPITGKAHTGIHSAMVIPTLYLPESGNIVTWEGQGVVNEAIRKIGAYFQGYGHSKSFTIDLPAHLKGKTPAQIYSEIKNMLHPALQEAYERRLRMMGPKKVSYQESWVKWSETNSYMGRSRAASLMDKYQQPGTTEELYNKKYRRFILRADHTEKLWSAGGVLNSSPFEYKPSMDEMVMELDITQDGKIHVHLEGIRELKPGTKALMGATKNAKTVFFGSFGGASEALNFAGNRVGAVVGGKWGGSRHEIGSFLEVQVGRMMRHISEDPKLNRDPHKLVRAAKKAMSPLLGDNVTFIPHSVPGSNTYWIEPVLPSFETMDMYGRLTGDNLIASIYESGLTWNSVKQQFLENARKEGLSALEAGQKFDEFIQKTSTEFDAIIHKLQKKIPFAKTAEEIRELEATKNWYLKIRNTLNLKDGDKAALFDVVMNKYAGKPVVEPGMLAYSSMHITTSISDYVTKNIGETIETATGLPLGRIQQGPYFTMMLEENLLEAKADPKMGSFIDRAMGLTYINKKGEMPVAESLAWIKTGLDLMKYGNVSEGITGIQQLLDSAGWLKKHIGDSPAGRVTAQALNNPRNYRVVKHEELKKVISLLDPQTRRAEMERFFKGMPPRSEEDIIKSIADTYKLSEEVVADRLRGKQEFRMFADTLHDMPIFDPEAKAKMNLVEFPSVKQLLLNSGYSEKDILKDPKLRELSKLKLKLDFGGEIIEELIRDSNMSDRARRILLERAKTLGSTEVSGFIPIPGFTGGLAPWQTKYYGQNIAAFTSEHEVVRSLLSQIYTFQDEIKTKAGLMSAEEAEMKLGAIKTGVMDMMRYTMAPNFKNLLTKANTLFPKGTYGVHASTTMFYHGMNQIMREASEGKNIGSETVRRVMTQASLGTRYETSVAKALKSGATEEMKTLAQALYKMNTEQTVTYAGLGIGEAFVSETEAKQYQSTLLKEYNQKIKASREIGATAEVKRLTKERNALKGFLSDWIEGKTYNTDIRWKAPEFTHGNLPVTGVYVYSDELFDQLGIDPKEVKGFIHSNPHQSKFVSAFQADYDWDLMGKLNPWSYDDIMASREMVSDTKRLLLEFAQREATGDQSLGKPGPLDLDTIHPLGGDRYGYRVTPETVRTFGESGVEEMLPMFENGMPMGAYRQAVKKGLVIKTYAGTLGAKIMRMRSMIEGPESPIRTLLDDVKANPTWKKAIGGEAGYGALEESINRLLQPGYNAEAVKGRLNISPARATMSWFGYAGERVAIMKLAARSGDPVDFLNKWEDTIGRFLGKGEITEADIEFLRNNEQLKGNKVDLPRFFLFADEQESQKLSRQALQDFNKLFRSITAINLKTEGQAYPDWMENLSKLGSDSSVKLVREGALGLSPGVASSLSRRRHRLSRAIGLIPEEINWANAPLSEIDVLAEEPAAKSKFWVSGWNELFGRMAGREKITSIYDDISRLFKPSGKSSLMAGAMVLGSVLFLSPNMGVTPVGRGGEEHDWPSFNLSAPDISVHTPTAYAAEKLMDIERPTPRRVPVSTKLPPPPAYKAYKSDLRKRNWTIDTYVNRAEAVLLT